MTADRPVLSEPPATDIADCGKDDCAPIEHWQRVAMRAIAALRSASTRDETGLLRAETVGRVIDEHYRARRDADPKGPPVHECGSYCGADIASRLEAVR